MAKLTRKLENIGKMRKLTIWDSDHTPSWRRYDKGYAYLEVTNHAEAGWLDVSVTEGYRTEEGKKREVSRQCTMTLDEENALALLALLKKVYEPQQETTP